MEHAASELHELVARTNRDAQEPDASGSAPGEESDEARQKRVEAAERTEQEKLATAVEFDSDDGPCGGDAPSVCGLHG